MAGITRTAIPTECKICNSMCADSSARTAHLRKMHNIKTDEDKINYLLTYDTKNNYYCETGDGSLKEFKRMILAEIPIEEKCYKLSKDKYSFIKDLDKKYDKFRVMADYLFLDLKLSKDEITTNLISNNKSRFSVTSLEYFVNKTNGDIEKAKKLLHKRQSTTHEPPLNRLINKYGEDEGLRRWDERNNKCALTLEGFVLRHGESKGLSLFKKYNTENKINIQSKCALALFNEILLQYEEIDNLDNVYMSTLKTGEFNLLLTLDEIKYIGVKNLYTDFKYFNKIIEFYGDYWHKNPLLYENNKDNKIIWEYDQKRLEILKNRGFEVLVIWEKNFTETPLKIIKQCIDFLKS